MGEAELADVIVDVRCLQDPRFAGRGIGRHSTALLEGARDQAGVGRLIALHDPALPPLSGRTRAVFDMLRPTAATFTLDRPVWFVELSPMTHDPLFVARLLQHAAPLTAAVVYDFIPFDERAQYLSDPATRLDYHVALAWLARYDLFAPISRASGTRLRELIPAAETDVVVTGAPLDPLFEGFAGGAAPRHVLVVGGGDARKNVECAIRAHAACAAMQAARLRLVITGGYAAEQVARFRDDARAAGGDPALVDVPGHVDEAELARLYGAALAVVVPSRAEGFSLPVIEAMAAGVPAVGSRIPPHEELISDSELMFPPEAPAALGAILERLTEPGFRAAAVAGQQAVWPRYRAAAVARRFWEALAARAARRTLPPPAAVPGGRRPRIALATPLPPDRSGVADFTFTGCAALVARAELDIFTPTPLPRVPAGVRSVQPLSPLPYLSADYDRVVSVMGNSEFHLGIERLLTRYGGACVAHDSRMLGFYAILHGTPRACALAEAELRRPVSPTELAVWMADETQLPATLMGPVAGSAAPLFQHSRLAVRNTLRLPGADARYLPFPLYRLFDAAALEPAARAAARERLGLQGIVIASFGFVHWTKAPAECIWAVSLLRGWGIDASLHFVGAAHMDLGPLRALLRETGMEAHVRLGDAYFGEAAYRDYLLAADLGLQLRSFANGAVSGALQDCIAAGLASVANADLAEAIEAPDYVLRVPDALSPVLIAEALAKLLDDGANGHRHAAARLDYADAHSFARYTDRLFAALGLE